MSTISCYNLFFDSIYCNSSASDNQSFCDFVLETALGHLLYRRCPKGWLFLPGETAAADAGCSHKSVGATAESPAFTQAKAGETFVHKSFPRLFIFLSVLLSVYLCKTAGGGLTVAGVHVLAGLVHDLDDLIK